MEFRELSKQEFDGFVKNHPQSNFLQTSAQAAVISERSWNAALVGLVENGQVVAAAVLSWTHIHTGELFKIDGGMLIDYNNAELVKAFLDGTIAFAKKHNGVFLEVMPNKVHRKFNDEGELLEAPDESVTDVMVSLGGTHVKPTRGMTVTTAPYWQYTKDLTPILESEDPEKALLDSFAKDGKYYTKKVNQFGITTRRLGREDLPAFKDLTQSTADRLHYHDKELSYYEKVFDIFGDDAYFVFSELDFQDYIDAQREKSDDLQKQLDDLDARIAEKPNYKKLKRQRNEFADQQVQHEKRIEDAQAMMEQAGQRKVVLSGALFLASDVEMMYLYSGTYEEYKKYYGPYAVQNYAFKVAIDRKIPRYNFYGISGVLDGSDGVLGFKQGFNGQIEEKVGSYIFPVNKSKYAFYRFAKKVLGRS